MYEIGEFRINRKMEVAPFKEEKINASLPLYGKASTPVFLDHKGPF
jgi:hypothetical protein